MTRVVVDTNVLVSGFARPRSLPGKILRRCEAGGIVLVLSEYVLAEFHRTLAKPWFVRELELDLRIAADVLLRRLSEIVVPDTGVSGIATHDEDDPILATATAGNADYIVTGDRQLLALGTYEGVRIVSPAAFLALLDAGDTDN